jgi:hypothetical protein
LKFEAEVTRSRKEIPETVLGLVPMSIGLLTAPETARNVPKIKLFFERYPSENKNKSKQVFRFEKWSYLNFGLESGGPLLLRSQGNGKTLYIRVLL